MVVFVLRAKFFRVLLQLAFHRARYRLPRKVDIAPEMLLCKQPIEAGLGGPQHTMNEFTCISGFQGYDRRICIAARYWISDEYLADFAGHIPF